MQISQNSTQQAHQNNIYQNNVGLKQEAFSDKDPYQILEINPLNNHKSKLEIQQENKEIIRLEHLQSEKFIEKLHTNNKYNREIF